MLSVKNGNIHVASYLLKIGVSPDAEDSSGNVNIVNLSHFVYFHHFFFVKWSTIFIGGIETTTTHTIFSISWPFLLSFAGNKGLHYACVYGWSDCVKLLIEVGADINASNSWMTTPLELALKKGRFACAVILLKQTVDVNVINTNGVSLFNSLVVSYAEQLSQNNDLTLSWAIRKVSAVATITGAPEIYHLWYQFSPTRLIPTPRLPKPPLAVIEPVITTITTAKPPS